MPAFEVLLWFCSQGAAELVALIGIRRQVDYGSGIRPTPITNRAARATPQLALNLLCRTFNHESRMLVRKQSHRAMQIRGKVHGQSASVVSQGAIRKGL
jgi:hypothetical protein